MAMDRTEGIKLRLDHAMSLIDSKKDYKGIVLLKDVRLAVYKAIGYDERTIKKHIKIFIELGWLKRLNRHQFKVTGEHINDDF